MRNQTETSDQLGKEIFIANFELADKKVAKKEQASPNIVFMARRADVLN